MSHRSLQGELEMPPRRTLLCQLSHISAVRIIVADRAGCHISPSTSPRREQELEMSHGRAQAEDWEHKTGAKIYAAKEVLFTCERIQRADRDPLDESFRICPKLRIGISIIKIYWKCSYTTRFKDRITIRLCFYLFLK
jgi:hypothetical protein